MTAPNFGGNEVLNNLQFFFFFFLNNIYFAFSKYFLNLYGVHQIMLFASSTFASLELRYVYMNSNNRLDKTTRRENHFAGIYTTCQ